MNWSATPERLAIIVFLALAAGWALGQWWRARDLRRNRGRIRREAIGILQDAERQRKATIVDAEIQARESLVSEKRRLEHYERELRDSLRAREEALREREAQVAKRQDDVSRFQERLLTREVDLTRAFADIDAQREQAKRELERISQLTTSGAEQEALERARQAISASVEREARIISERSLGEVQERAQELVVQTMERLARALASERTICCIPVESQEVRGRIIGRDGRNVRAFEAITGVDVLLDELPDHAVLSCHDPRRREVARRAMVALIQDGRIQPARIEQIVKETEQVIEEELLQRGRDAAITHEIGPISDDVARTLGGLAFRTSYGQNVLHHLDEATRIVAMVAAELGLSSDDARRARRATLLHDLGKGLSDGYGPSHALAGAELLQRAGDDPLVINAVAAHHREVADESFFCALVRAADAISGARPGARREDVEATLRRVRELEELALAHHGVHRAYALQAGRELHVVVSHETISDAGAEALAHELAYEIEQKVPIVGRSSVVVVRERRAVVEVGSARRREEAHS